MGRMLSESLCRVGRHAFSRPVKRGRHMGVQPDPKKLVGDRKIPHLGTEMHALWTRGLLGRVSKTESALCATAIPRFSRSAPYH